jgi:hypothetical protein
MMHGIAVRSSGLIQGGISGTLTVQGTGGNPDRNFNYGVSIDGANARITSLGAGVHVIGLGGGDPLFTRNYGVAVLSGGEITASGNGTVTVQGTGGATSRGNSGVYLFGTGSQITSSGGAVNVIGYGSPSVGTDGSSIGVYVRSEAAITAGNNGNVTVQGTGGNTDSGNIGVNIEGTGTIITSSGGDVSVTGFGGGNANAFYNYGVNLEYGGKISAGGNGTVMVQGTGGMTGGNLNVGVRLRDDNATITSSGGSVTVIGQGGGSGDSEQNHGVSVAIGEISAGANGTVTVQGTGGTTTGGRSYGVEVISSSLITSSGGAVSVTGQGGGSGTSDRNFGVLVFSGGKITAGGNGTVSIQGTGGNSSGGGNFGVRVNGDSGSSQITSSGGAVSVTGIEGGGFSGIGIVNEFSGTITTIPNSGNITLNANSMSISAGVSTPSSNSVTLRPYSTGIPIDLGSTASVGGPLKLSDTELDFITTSTLIIGDANSGAITISAAITRAANTAMQLITAGDITLDQGINTAGGNLLLDCGTSPKAIFPTFNGTDANLGAGTLSFASDIAFAINGTTAGDGTGATYSQLVVNGSVNLTGHTLALSGSYTETVGDVITLVNNDGSDAIIGTFVGLAEGTLVSTGPFNTRWARISYVGGSGNDVTLTVAAPDYTISSVADLTISDNAGNGDRLDVTQNGTGIQFATTPARTYALNGGGTMLFPVTVANVANFNNITINTQVGDDVNNIGDFTAALKNLTINGGTGNDVVNFNGDITFASNANLNVDLQNDDATPGTDNVTVATNANLVLSGTGAATAKVSRLVQVNAGGSIETMNGNLTVEANQQVVPIAGGFIGIEVRGTLKVSDSGLLTVNGKGGNSSNNNYGVWVRNGGKVEGGTAATSVQGTGGSSMGNNNSGVLVDGTNSKITSSGGNVSVTGTGGGSGSSGGNHGIYVISTGQITAGGSGTVTVLGNGGTAAMGNRNYGVLVVGAGTQITSSGGNVSVTGTGGGSGTSSDNHGIYVQNGGQITAGGSGTVSVVGNGGTAPTGLGNQGVYVESAGTQITSSGGNVSVTGTGGGSGSSRENYGVYVVSFGRITAGGNGTLTIVGTGGSSTSDRNYGVYVLAKSQITSSGGDVSVSGVEGSGSSGIGFVSASFGQVTTVPNGGNITLIANSMSISADVSTPSGNSVTLRPYTNGVQINLDFAIDPIGGPIRLTDTELDSITTGTLNIGNVNTGNITVSAAITRPVSTVINLTTGGQVNLSASALNSAGGNVNIDAPNGTNPTATGTDVNTGASSTLDFTAGNKLKIAINGTTVDAQYSQLKVEGKVDITGVNLEFSGSFVPSACQNPFMIVNNDGTDAIIGTFTGLAEGATIPNFRGSGLNAKISYIGGDGNDVTLRLIGVTPPTITCPANIVRNNDAGQCSAVVAYTTPTALDNCGLPTPPQWISGGTSPTVSGTNSVSTYPKNVTIVTWRATDDEGNTATCSFSITVVDAQPPTVICPANIIRPTDPNLCSAVVHYTTPIYSDNCAGGSAVLSSSGITSGSAFPKGISTVLWQATDGVGLTKTCSFTITVNDAQAPTITCPANMVRNSDAGQCSAVVTYPTPKAADNCSLPAGQPQWVSGGTSPTASGANSIATFQKGANIVTWRATDGAGLTKTCTFRVTVNDTEAPTLTCPAAMNLTTATNACNAVATYTNPTFTDNCALTNSTATRINGLVSGSAFPVGNSNVVFQATDAAGNTRRCTMVITVTDNQPPVITCPLPVVATGTGVPCSATVLYGSATASDNCTGPLTPFLVTGLASGSIFPTGVTTNTFRAVAPNGQSSECSFSVSVDCGSGMGNNGVEVRNTNLSIQHGDKLELKLAPNPALSTVTVSIEGVGAGGGTLLVFDAVGRLVLRQVIAENQQTAVFQVDGAEFAPGMYRVNLRTETGMVTKTLVVVK